MRKALHRFSRSVSALPIQLDRYLSLLDWTGRQLRAASQRAIPTQLAPILERLGIIDRVRELAGLFAVEVCGYPVMSNDVHLVLRNRPDIAEQWSDDEIALRWRRVFPPRDDATGEPVEPTDHDLAMLTANPERLAELRKRLSPRGQARGDSGAPGPDRGAAGTQSIELGGNGARIRSAVQAGGRATEPARRYRGALLAALVSGQGGGPDGLSVGQRLDAEP